MGIVPNSLAVHVNARRKITLKLVDVFSSSIHGAAAVNRTHQQRHAP